VPGKALSSIASELRFKMVDHKLDPEISTDARLDDFNERKHASADSNIEEVDLLKITKTSSVLTVLVSGVALFSDGYNAQISKSRAQVDSTVLTPH
jgi:hypothetical protein